MKYQLCLLRSKVLSRIVIRLQAWRRLFHWRPPLQSNPSEIDLQTARTSFVVQIALWKY